MDTLMKYIARIFRCSILYRNEILAHEGLNGYQHTYIIRICNHPGISQEQLARMIYVNKSTVTRQLALLEQNGFVTRKPGSADKRTMLVYPTQKALDVFPKVKAASQAWNDALTEGLSSEERDWLFAKLSLLMERAEAEAAQTHEGRDMQ